MARKTEEEEPSSYSWMDTYGDMVTLLLCFFVLLYSFSTIDAVKWKQLVAAFTGDSGSRVVTGIGEKETRDETIAVMNTQITFSKSNRELKENQEISKDDSSGLIEVNASDAVDALYQSIKTFIEANNMQSSVSISRTDEAIYLRFNEMALFKSGFADILPESEKTLNNIMFIIKEYVDYIAAIRIEGHTDNVPINTAQFQDNWDLASKRATNVLRQVLTYKIFDEEMLSAVGYGEFHPIADNSTPEGRALNRRVDFVLVRADYVAASPKP